MIGTQTFEREQVQNKFTSTYLYAQIHLYPNVKTTPTLTNTCAKAVCALFIVHMTCNRKLLTFLDSVASETLKQQHTSSHKSISLGAKNKVTMFLLLKRYLDYS